MVNEENRDTMGRVHALCEPAADKKCLFLLFCSCDGLHGHYLPLQVTSSNIMKLGCLH